MAVLWLDEISSGDLEKVGGKGASLGELTGAGLPVPPGFVVTAGTYRSFIEEAEIDEELFAAVDVDVDDSAALADAADRAQELIIETPFPDELREEILESYREVGDGEAFVAVRSSATAEDLPDASFAGQQETFLNVTEEDLLNRVRECWASLFTQRAIYYRQEQGFDHSAVNIAVVVQQMVDAEKSGVMFTSHPSTGDKTMIIEAAWGLGEAVVSGAVSPDNYVIDREDRSMDVTVAEKKVMHEKDEATGQTVEREVPEDKRTARVVSDDEIDDLMDLGERVEDHYGDPQDVEWAIVGGDVYMLQSRPITTIDEDESDAADPTGSVDTATGLTDGSGGVQSADTDSAGAGSDAGATGTGDVIVDGLGSSPGTVSGPAKIVTKLDDLAKVSEGDIIVTEMTMPDMVPAMKRASGIITDEGGMTSHAAIVSRELGVPAIVGTTNATTVLEDGQVVTLDGDKGAVLEGKTVDPDEETEPVEEVRPQSPVKPMTATEVKVNVSIPEAAERAAATGADGVGLLRTEHMILSLNQTPEKFIEENGTDAYTTELVEGIRGVADAFYPRPVRVRTLDAPTDEFRQLEGGDDEPAEHNPMLGYRGIRRSLDRQDVFAHELEAFRRLYELGYDNVEIMFPLVNDAEDIYRAKECMKQAGIDPEKRKWGAMIETPASALSVEGMAEAGIDFASFGTNDLTQYTLAVDRNNEHVADRFDELHPAVLRLIGDVIETCREHDVDTSICGQAGSKPEMVQFLANEGITSISANIDAVRDVQHEVKRVEQKLLLDSVR
ncbi:phosphoenolpyruvate synthase [Natrinema salinisoli]|uniref:phosphoenolpyruvate synthase n=1 Tax=Natrinema salinisoli TaxID=2878535 RepID=UPI001CF09C44|nr:phosphoenolpyruvate synthase [Natrinema salinisoli]